MGKLILVAGYPAAGKSVFSLRLAEKLGIQCFNKDTIKEILGEVVGFANRQENKTLSEATFFILKYIAQAFMKTDKPLILESNFRVSEEPYLRELIEEYGYDTLTFMLTGDLDVIYKRYALRECSPERHFAHKAANLVSADFFKEAVKSLADFNIGGRIVTVDMTGFDNVDYNGLYEIAEGFLNGH